MTLTELPPQAADGTRVQHPPGLVSATPGFVSGAPEFVSATPETVSGAPKRNRSASERLTIVLMLVAAVGGMTIGAIGFAMSYSTLAKVAGHWGFGPGLAPWFPVGVDASIVAFLALDLFLISKDTAWPVLRVAAHTMTAATIWFNASSQGAITADPVRSASHGVMPLLFVIGVEAGRRLFIKKVQLETGTHTDRIPLSRWVLAPVATPRIYRRMRLYGVTSYPEMVRREQDLIGYEQWLSRKYNGDLSKADEDELLPMKMAPYGYTVAEALALPEQQESDAEDRAEDAERRSREAATRRELAEKAAEAERLLAQGKLEAVRAQVEGETGKARAHARAQVSAAERASELEEQELETAVMAEARARQAEADRKEAEERKAKAGLDAETAELERVAAEKRKAAAEADRVAQAETAAVETQAIAEARKAAAEADRAAAEIERDAAETRRAAAETRRQAEEDEARSKDAEADAAEADKRAAEARKLAAETRAAVAEIERRAVEAEDTARLKPRERAARRVARMILAAGGDVNAVPLAEIQSELAVTSAGTASEYRQEAIDLLAAGYRPGQ